MHLKPSYQDHNNHNSAATTTTSATGQTNQEDNDVIEENGSSSSAGKHGRNRSSHSSTSSSPPVIEQPPTESTVASVTEYAIKKELNTNSGDQQGRKRRLSDVESADPDRRERFSALASMGIEARKILLSGGTAASSESAATIETPTPVRIRRIDFNNLIERELQTALPNFDETPRNRKTSMTMRLLQEGIYRLFFVIRSRKDY